MEDKYLSISQITKYVKRKFDQDPYLEKVYLRGEISNSKRNRRYSHMYFSLKDNDAKISAVMFKNSVSRLKFDPEEGMGVLVTGRLTVYEKTGQYQIIIDDMEPDGIGALYKALEQLKEKLTKEGLFDPSLKKELVKYPKRIAIVTSQSGAVIRDIVSTISRRYPLVELVLFPTYVQGVRSVDSVVSNIQRADKDNRFDTMIIGRGGGSIEDLWSFNDEKVVRAIVNAQTPIISSVGHETDTTLSDYAADVRAATPTAAAELAVPVLRDEQLKIDQYEKQLIQNMMQRLASARDHVNYVTDSYIFRQPSRLYEGYSINIDHKSQELINVMNQLVKEQTQKYELINQQLNSLKPDKKIQQGKEREERLENDLTKAFKRLLIDREKGVDNLIQSLDHLSPLKILSRGYSYTTKDDEIIKTVDSVQAEEEVVIHLADGQIETEVKKVRKKEDG